MPHSSNQPLALLSRARLPIMRKNRSFYRRYFLFRTLLTALDNIAIFLLDRHIKRPTHFGNGPHDCALNSLYWAVPSISEKALVEAFQLCTDHWPYGGVYNSEFSTVLDYLKLSYSYTDHDECFREVLAGDYQRAVVLFNGHFAPIIKGQAYGCDAHYNSRPDVTVLCKWIFR